MEILSFSIIDVVCFGLDTVKFMRLLRTLLEGKEKINRTNINTFGKCSL